MSDNQLADVMVGIAKGLGSRLREAQHIEDVVKHARGSSLVKTASGSRYTVRAIATVDGSPTQHYSVVTGSGKHVICADIVVDPSTMNLSLRDELGEEFGWSSRVLEVASRLDGEVLYSRAAYKAAQQ